MSLTDNISQKIVQIADILRLAYSREQSYSLMAGGCGMALFFDSYFRISGDAGSLVPKTMNHVFSLVAKMPIFPTYAAGLAGTGAVACFLESRSVSAGLVEDDVDDYLSKALYFYQQEKDYDYLHGAIGIALYFLFRYRMHPSPEKRLLLDGMLHWLEDSACVDGMGLKWASENFRTKNQEYNISLSHGMSGIIAFLLKMHEIVPEAGPERIKRLVRKSVDYIVRQQISPELYGAYFPYLAIESTGQIDGSRLAWCYGDLGISVTLYRAARLLGDQDLEAFSLEVLTFAAHSRRGLLENKVIDAGFCHGAAGVAHIFNRMYLYTGNPVFIEAALYWTERVLEMATYENAYAGYRIWHPGTPARWSESYGLLEGIAGIGLALTGMSDRNTMHWDELMLLS